MARGKEGIVWRRGYVAPGGFGFRRTLSEHLRHLREIVEERVSMTPRCRLYAAIA